MKDVEVKSLKGKTILVTGSGKGLGSAIAVEAARQGAKVAVHYRSSEKNAYQVFEEVRAEHFVACHFVREINHM